jgi:polar amino acid transport system substrate-binding protein
VKILGGLLLVAFALAACGDDGDDTEAASGGEDLGLVSDGTLTVCTDVPYPPMEFEDADSPGGYTGFDIELMRAIADDNGLELAVAVPGWDAITSGLAMESGSCDISAASITITDEREENVDFSNSYFSAEQSLLVQEDASFSSLSDLTSVAVQSGTTGETWLADNTPDGVEVIAFEAIGDLYLALEAGEADGVITDLVGNQGYVDEAGGAKVIESYDTGELYGLAVKEEGSESLLTAVNASLDKLTNDGTYDDIYGEWFSG